MKNPFSFPILFTRRKIEGIRLTEGLLDDKDVLGRCLGAREEERSEILNLKRN